MSRDESSFGQRTSAESAEGARASESFVPEGHRNFPRLGWTTFGVGLGALAYRLEGVAAVTLFAIYGVAWSLWAIWLLGRSSGVSAPRSGANQKDGGVR